MTVTSDIIDRARQAVAEAEGDVVAAQRDRDPDAEGVAWDRARSKTRDLDALLVEQRQQLAVDIARLLPADPGLSPATLSAPGVGPASTVTTIDPTTATTTADPVEAELAGLLVDMRQAEELGDRGLVARLNKNIEQLEELRTGRSREAERGRLVETEVQRRVAEASSAATAAAEDARRNDVDALVAKLATVAELIDASTNDLTNAVGAYRATTEQLEQIDTGVPWNGSMARAAEWLSRRLNLATGGRGFARSESEAARAHSFAAGTAPRETPS